MRQAVELEEKLCKTLIPRQRKKEKRERKKGGKKVQRSFIIALDARKCKMMIVLDNRVLLEIHRNIIINENPYEESVYYEEVKVLVA